MLPWKLLGAAKVPHDGSEMQLFQRGDEYSIRVGSHELMNSRMHGSEEALAELGCAQLANRATARVLIGGLGMGFTLAAVLRGIGRKASVVVAELVPEVIQWNRDLIGEASERPLNDRRVTVREADVATLIRHDKKFYDAILLDVDNGPAALTNQGNNWLYGFDGLRAAHEALRPQGVLAVWSSGPDPLFTKRLEDCGFAAKETKVRGHGKSGYRYVVWIAKRQEAVEEPVTRIPKRSPKR